MKYTDDAFKDLLDYFKDFNEPVLIVFWGDHQPETKVLDILWNRNGKNRDTLSENDIYNTYRVPFIIWANYDIDEKTGLETSANYLGNLALDAAGLPLSPYRSLVQENFKDYPVISAIRVMDSRKVSHEPDSMAESLLNYQKTQYYQLFDDNDEYP